MPLIWTCSLPSPCANGVSREGLQPQVIVHRDLYILLRPQIAFGGLDGGVAEQELDLLQIPATLAAQFGAGAAEVVAPKCSIPICFDDCSTTDHTASRLRIRLAAAPKGQHSHVVEVWDAVGKRPHIVKAGVDQLGRLPRSLPVHQCHDAVHAVLTTLVAGF